MSRIRSIHPKEIPDVASHERYIYVIGEIGSPFPNKVGMSRHPLWRLFDLQSGNFRRLELRAVWIVDNRTAALRLEAEIHEAMKSSLVSGEWFAAPVEGIRELVEATTRDWRS